jgi:nucleotide-binding universal stress UspA family protein
MFALKEETMSMYRNILVATDGSKLAGKGIREGVKVAKALGASVTGVYVAAPFAPPIYAEGSIYPTDAYSPREYRKLTERASKKALAAVERAARSAHVRCRTRFVTDNQAWRGILRAARAAHCDAIAMGSHGRGAVGGLLLGSETSRVLAHSKLPVLVVR